MSGRDDATEDDHVSHGCRSDGHHHMTIAISHPAAFISSVRAVMDSGVTCMSCCNPCATPLDTVHPGLVHQAVCAYL